MGAFLDMIEVGICQNGVIPMEDFTIREYREGDEVEINRVFNEVFCASRSLDEWRWKFIENPINARVIAVAEAAGRIVGQYPNVIALFQYVNKVVPVTLPADNFVIPRFRGGIKGVEKAMHEFQRRLWPRPLACGFPTQAHLIIGKRILNYKEIGKMPVLFMRLNFRLAVRNRVPWMPSYLLAAVRSASNLWFRIFVKTLKFRAASVVTTRIVDSFDARIDALWERVKGKHGIICVRDSRYLGWRYRKPGARYRIIIAEKGDELVGYAVTGERYNAGATEGHIVDLFADDSPEVLDALVRRSVLDLLSRKADYALCWMLRDKGAFRALCEIGFAPKEDVFPPVNIAFQIFDRQIVDEKVAGDARNWFLTMGDSDVY